MASRNTVAPEGPKLSRYTKHLDALAARRGGELTAEIVLQDAIRSKSPIHDYFEWEDSEAARQYRLEQARRLIRTCYVIVRDDVAPESTVKVRRFEHVAGSYRHTEDALQNASWRDEILQRLARDIALLRERYRTYSRISGEVSVVDEHLQAAETIARERSAA